MLATPTSIASFRKGCLVLMNLLLLCATAFTQITVTNSTFPTAGTTLRMATASNPGIAINQVFTPPGGNQTWDLSGLQRGTVKTTVFKAASEGSQAANVPGAELVSTSSSSPLAETYYNVTSGRFEIQATYDKFYDVVPLYLSKNSLPLPDRYAPLNFFDIYQSSSTEFAGSNCIPVADIGGTVFECSFSPADFPSALISQLPVGAEIYRYRVTKQRLDVVDAWGTMIIPGGSYPVLRMKRTEYTDVRLDGKYPPLGWIDITDQATTTGFQGLGVCTTYTSIFVNDVEKEPIAVVTSGCLGSTGDPFTASAVEYKLVSPLLSINNVTQTEGNNGTTNFNFTVSLSAPAPTGGVTFDIATANGTTNPATQPSDYTAKSLTSQTIPAGSSTYTFTVAVNGDVDVEPNETFFVNVSNVTGAVLDDGQGLGTITNDDVAACSISSASFSNVSACNNNGTPSNPADDFYTADLTVNFINPPATGTLRIEPGNVNVLDVVEVPVGSLSGNSHTFTGVRLRTTGAIFAVELEFSADNGCVRTIAAPAVSSCSTPAACSITSVSLITAGACNNNGTPSNTADDFYTADLTVNFINPPATGTLRIEPGNVNVLDVVEVPVGSLSGNSHTFTGVRLRTTGAIFAVEVEFSADNGCVRTIAAPAVNSCAVTCSVVCPANIIVNSSTNQCGAIVSYPAATADAACGALTYSVASGSFFPVGVTTVHVTSAVGPGCSFTVTVLDKQKPVISCPSDIKVTADPNTCSKSVTFNVTASDNCPGVTVTTVPASGSSFPVGTTKVTATATDASGNITIRTFDVKVRETKPPVIQVKTSPTILQWPANGSYQRVSVSQFVQSVSDNCGNIPVGKVNIIKVTSDEAEDAPGNADGTTRKDIRIADDCKSVDLRRERRQGGNGRVYTIYVAVSDASGNRAAASYKVFMPASQGGQTAGDNGIAYYVTCDCGDDDRRTAATSAQSFSLVDDSPRAGISLEQNYPNPFGTSTVVRYSIPEQSQVILAVYNSQGQLVMKLEDGKRSAGAHEVRFDGTKLAAGTYLYRLQVTPAGGSTQVLNRRMIISR